MGDFSRAPDELLRASAGLGYVGVHIEQGVPILDRDLNLMHDLVADAVHGLAARYIGDGAPAGSDGFLITPAAAANDFTIGRGTLLTGGFEVVNPTPLTYSAQKPAPDTLHTPTADRTDVVYLETWVEEVDATTDDDLRNDGDVGMQTAVRLAVRWRVGVAEGAADPPGVAGRNRYPLARLKRKATKATVDASMIEDLRRGRLTVADLERRLTLIEVALLLPAFTGVQLQPRTGQHEQVINLVGNNLDRPETTVAFGGQNADIKTRSATGLGVAVPTAVPLTPGGVTPVDVTVTTRFGSTTSDFKFGVTE